MNEFTHLRIELSGDGEAAVIEIETARKEDDVNVTVHCSPEAAAEYLDGLRAALMAMEAVSQSASLRGLLN